MKVKEDVSGKPTRRRRGKPPADSYKTKEDLTERIIAYCENRVKGFAPKMAGLLINPTAGEQQVEVWESTPGVREYLAEHGMTQDEIKKAQGDQFMTLWSTLGEVAIVELTKKIQTGDNLKDFTKLYQVVKDALNVRVVMAARGEPGEEKDRLTDEAIRKLLPESTE